MQTRILYDAGMGCSRRELLQSAAGVTLAAMMGRAVRSQTTSPAVSKSPAIDKRLIVHTQSPHNAEGALGDLIENWITPGEHFFVRSHAPQVPEIDPATFRVSVEGLVERPLDLSVRDLEAFPQTGVTATLSCAGNRRFEHNAIREVSGVLWREGAIGNARWGGVALAELLNRAGVQPGARHIWFESVDEVQGDDGGTFAFGGSIPIEKALADRDGVPGGLLTLRMNDAPLAADHGFPVRMVVPGYIGARSVKWLRRIVVSDRPSPNHFLADVYKLVTEESKLAQVESGPIYSYPINAAICAPASSSPLKAGRVTIRGYAQPPGNGARVSRVDVSVDGGTSWAAANITSRNVPYCWVLWEATVPVTAATSELIVRATDSAGLVQPQAVPWNLKGYLYNAWHHVPVTVTS
ncbi:MAG: molybdopterin-dependent oxidoreductase [Planctomycetaceae bacterium]